MPATELSVGSSIHLGPEVNLMNTNKCYLEQHLFYSLSKLIRIYYFINDINLIS